MKQNKAKLFIVATPIGNLEDITLRALRILKEVEVIACEDTRVSKKLLTHFNIHTPLISFHAHSGVRGMEKILNLLTQGKTVALISDAGTPGISDPGLELVSLVRERLGDTVSIETIPGASALAAAIAVSGLRVNHFVFYGFLPPQKGREKLFAMMAKDTHASIFYESPYRILKALHSLETHLDQTRRVGIFRELTKLYEESIVGGVSHISQILTEHPEKQRGEFVVIVEAKK